MAETPVLRASFVRPIPHLIWLDFLVRHPGDKDGLRLAVVLPVAALGLKRVKP